MEVKTYRAGSLQEALQLVRRDLGPEAAVLHTREVRGGLLPWISRRQIEVTASATVNVPSRFVDPPAAASTSQDEAAPTLSSPAPAAEDDFRAKFRADLRDRARDEHSLIEELCQQTPRTSKHDLPDSLFHLFTDLIDAEVSDDLARDVDCVDAFVGHRRVGFAAAHGQVHDIVT